MLVGLAGGLVTMLNVNEGISVTAEGGLDMSKDIEGTENISVINIKKNIAIGRNLTLTLPASATKVNIKSDSEITSGTVTWKTGCKGATINIAAGATFSLIGATIEGVPSVTFASEEEEGMTRGQLDNTMNGTIKNCTNTVKEGWWKGNQASTMILAEGVEVSMAGEYIVNETGSDEGMTFAEGLTGRVLLSTTTGKETTVRIYKDQEQNLKNATVVIGKNVRVILGKGRDAETYWQTETPDVNDIPDWIEGVNGAKLTITSATSKKFVYKDKKWSEE